MCSYARVPSCPIPRSACKPGHAQLPDLVSDKERERVSERKHADGQEVSNYASRCQNTSVCVCMCVCIAMPFMISYRALLLLLCLGLGGKVRYSRDHVVEMYWRCSCVAAYGNCLFPSSGIRAPVAKC